MTKNKNKKNTSTSKETYLDINGKVKKTTAKHLRKVNKSNNNKKNGWLCSNCNQLVSLSLYTQEQQNLSSEKRACKKCLYKLEKRKQNKEIVLYIYGRMKLTSISVDKNHHSIAHETKERRKNKGDFRTLVLERDRYCCYYCQEHGDTIDHLIPISKGGFTSLENCVCSCEFCNHVKSDIDLKTFKNGMALFDIDEWRILRSKWIK